MPPDRLYRANLSLRELCLVEPLTVGFHAASRGRVAPSDTVAIIGCGRVVYIGYTKQEVACETSLFVQKELDILGSRNAQPEDFRDVIRMLEEHHFPVDGAITHTVAMDEAPRILAAWDRDPSHYGTIMIDVS